MSPVFKVLCFVLGVITMSIGTMMLYVSVGGYFKAQSGAAVNATVTAIEASNSDFGNYDIYVTYEIDGQKVPNAFIRDVQKHHPVGSTIQLYVDGQEYQIKNEFRTDMAMSGLGLLVAGDIMITIAVSKKALAKFTNALAKRA